MHSARLFTAIALSAVAAFAAGGGTFAAEPEKPAVAADSDPAGLEFFEKRIRPVLVKECYECHAADSKEVKGGLLLDTRDGLRHGGETGPAVVPGDVDGSLLMEALRHESFEMPPDRKLADNVIEDFAAWIKMGASDPRDGGSKLIKRVIDFDEGRQFWAFQPPKSVDPPAVNDADWSRDDIDRYVLARLESAGLSPVGDASRQTLIRRLYFDLVGLPPSPEEVAAFLADGSSDQEAVARLVDRLLDSPQFGERWGRHWLDVARFAESNGRERNFLYPHAWRYRDYVIASFNADKPFDRFIREQIAGDLIARDEPQRHDELITATGFLAIGPKLLNERDRETFRMDMVDEQVDVATRAVMSLTVSCARCHDHKFDPIPTAEYYSVAGIFRSSETFFGTSGNGNRQASKLIGLTQPALAANSNSAVGGPSDRSDNNAAAATGAQSAELARLQRELKAAREELETLTSSDDKSARKKRNAQQKKVQQIAAQVKKLRDGATTGAGGGNKSPSGPVAMGIGEGNVANSPIYIRGETSDPDGEAPRGWLTILSDGERPLVTGEESGRRELADWLASKDNPLTARVAVNRVWQHLFGAGLVPTVDNFGTTGQPATHPELLDRLAMSFVEDGWSVKRLIRRIVLTRTYQLDSAFDPRGGEVDPANTLLWRHSTRRLEAEAVRDATLAASGELDREPGAASPVARQADSQQVGRGTLGGFDDESFAKRSVYLPILRNAVPESLAVFDFAEPSIIVGQRDVTTVPAQSLYMMNSSFVIDRSDKLAERVINESADPQERIASLYQRTLQRPPTSLEADRALKYIAEMNDRLDGEGSQSADAAARERLAWASLGQALFASAEFRYVE